MPEQLQGRMSKDALADYLAAWVHQKYDQAKRVLLLPPDGTRAHSLAGPISNILYTLFTERGADVEVMPALGTHEPMSDSQLKNMFGSGIPMEAFVEHRWRSDVETIGEIPAEVIRRLSDGLMDETVPVTINKKLLHPSWDLILSIGQVVPHEVVGMANYTKNIVVGCGGKSLIDVSHFMGAVVGLESIMGRTDTAVRGLFDYVEEHLLRDLPLEYMLTVTTTVGGQTRLEGLFSGRDRHVFEEAAELSRELNLDLLDRPVETAIVYLDPDEFRTTWVGNKAVYRLRMAMKDGGHLIILAPGVKSFGEDREMDALLRAFGYKGRDAVMASMENSQQLQESRSAAAHLIHGSSEGRFTITYAVRHLTKEEIESVGFEYMDYDEAAASLQLDSLQDGWNTLDDSKEVFYVSNPALGLWALKENFKNEAE